MAPYSDSITACILPKVYLFLYLYLIVKTPGNNIHSSIERLDQYLRDAVEYNLIASESLPGITPDCSSMFNFDITR